MRQRKAVLVSQVRAWPKATKAEKSAILDRLVAVNGWHRDHARKMIRHALAGIEPPPRQPRAPVYTYGPQVIDALVTCWVVLDGPTGKRLAPALAELVPALSRHGHLTDVDDAVITALLAMSPATIDRRLAPYRTGLIATKGRSMTKPGSMLKSAIPLKTWAEWDESHPGLLQIDLVGHDGGDNNGQFHYTLDATDVATGWVETITVRSKGERIVATGLQELQLRFPFAISAIHSDNGGEFINHHLMRWCQTHQISYSRGRAAHSNDQAHIEQKNWSVVRRCVGYNRYDTPRELALLNDLWPAESLMGNLFTPQQKLASKTRRGAKVTKTYDPARTPLRRLLDDHAGYVTDQDRRRLLQLQQTTDPIAVREQIALIQANLLQAARRRGHVERRRKANAVYLSKTKIHPNAKRASTDESTIQPKRAS